MAEAVELIQFAEKHDWPVAGGILDQSDNFLQVMKHWNASLSEIRTHE